MTRKEQIKQGLEEAGHTSTVRDLFDYGFIRGAEWADQNPIEVNKQSEMLAIAFNALLNNEDAVSKKAIAKILAIREQVQ